MRDMPERLTDVRCPTCDAAPRHNCTTRYGQQIPPHPSRRTEMERVSRRVERLLDRRAAKSGAYLEALARACPFCGAQPSDPCINSKGRVHEYLHEERHTTSGNRSVVDGVILS